jgi:hypothetical protein
LHEEILLEPALLDTRWTRSVAVTPEIAFRLWCGDLILLNAGLAKPIHANWFIRPQPLICLNCMLQRFSALCRRGCATIRNWLNSGENAASHNQKISKENSSRSDFSEQRKRQYTVSFNCVTSLDVSRPSSNAVVAHRSRRHPRAFKSRPATTALSFSRC